MASAVMALKLASESKRSVTVTLIPHFKARLFTAILSLCLVSGLAGGGLMLDARASATTPSQDAAADQRRDDRLEYNERSVAELKDTVRAQAATIEEFKQEVSSVRGAMWVIGVLLGLLHFVSLALTIRGGIKRIEKEQHGQG